MGKHFNKDTVAEVLAFFQDGYSEKHIASVMHMSYKDIRIILRDYKGKEIIIEREFDDE